MKGRKTFSNTTKRYVFEQLERISDRDPKIWRMDLSGRTICYPSYGDFNSRYGWNIHHKNNDSSDNRLFNLEATSFELHDKYHNDRKD